MGKSTFLVRQRKRLRCEVAPLIVKLLRAAYHRQMGERHAGRSPCRGHCADHGRVGRVVRV